MDCPQCAAEVSSDDAFCGKCGYAMREGAPERIDQSRIRFHEGPESPATDTSSTGPSQDRTRKKTMVGIPSLTPRRGAPPAASTPDPGPPAPPAEISDARARAAKRTPQKTMLGIPRPDFAEPPAPPEQLDAALASEQTGEVVTERFAPLAETPPDSGAPGRERARVRYDSANEPYPMLQRRKKALRGLALLVLLSAGWFVYRFATLNG